MVSKQHFLRQGFERKKLILKSFQGRLIESGTIRHADEVCIIKQLLLQTTEASAHWGALRASVEHPSERQPSHGAKELGYLHNGPL